MVAPATETLLARVTSGKRAKRMVAILDLIEESGSISLNRLAATLAISTATARRDLSDLAEQNLIVRTHGGASAVDRGIELPVALRDTRHQDSKRAIARAMVDRLPPERYVIALCGGTTTASVARELAHHRDIAVVTNSLTIAGLLSAYPGVRVVMTGGFLRPQSLELVGALAESTFNSVNVGTAILGADGITAEAGITTHDETEARTNHAMVSKAKRTVVVADGSKIGRDALAQCCAIGEIDVLITDTTADAEEVRRIRDAGVEVVQVSTPSEP
jgi:DeoR family transcriptional regulator of aga operon